MPEDAMVCTVSVAALATLAHRKRAMATRAVRNMVASG
jgi:hypothetical protein